MKLEEMRYYVEIVDAGSINQASKTLYVAQPALSRTIASLEKELGFALLERSKHGVKPTAAGKTVYNDCVRILGLASDCEKHWQTLAYENQANKEPITISIVALPMVCNSTMNQALATIANDYPRITTRLFERQLGDILETTVDQMPAIAISHYNKETKSKFYNFAKGHQLQIRPLFDDEYQFFASKDNPLTWHPVDENALRNYTVANYSSEEISQGQNFIDANLTSYPKLFKNTLHLSNRHEMIEIAATTQIVTLAARRMTYGNHYRKTGQLRPIYVKGFYLPMTYCILYAHNPSIEEKITVDTLHSFFQSLADVPLHD